MSTATTPDKPGIGWFGLGKMGLSIRKRLAAQQFELTDSDTQSCRARARRARESGALTAGPSNVGLLLSLLQT